MKPSLSSSLIYGLISLIGLSALLYPFVLPAYTGAAGGQPHSADAPWITTILVSLCFAAVLLEIQGDGVNGISTKFIALLGVLVALNAALRFIETAIPGPGGFSPIFFLIVATGYVYGARFGFLMGALTLLVSALLTGGVGPWLPSQMLTDGWVGLTSAWFAPLARRRHFEGRRREIVLLAGIGFFWGLGYGAVTNLWFWPFISGPLTQQWTAGMTFGEALQHYGVFYLATSLVWDIGVRAWQRGFAGAVRRAHVAHLATVPPAIRLHLSAS
ncbi:MAG: ECF transporter S component [Anaerolineae bacterium]|nr:ECF transporter S component [Anaerolineae bacterium]